MFLSLFALNPYKFRRLYRDAKTSKNIATKLNPLFTRLRH